MRYNNKSNIKFNQQTVLITKLLKKIKIIFLLFALQQNIDYLNFDYLMTDNKFKIAYLRMFTLWEICSEIISKNDYFFIIHFFHNKHSQK